MSLARRGPALAALTCLGPGVAQAHAFGERYDLPAPLGYFVAGAAATVALSFVVALVAIRPERARPREDPSIGLGAAAPVLAVLVRAIAFAAFAAVVVAGLWGDQHPARNLAPTLVWILWWVGLSLATAMLGNAWPLIDPASTLFAALRPRAGRWAYPHALGTAPAVVLFLLFAWAEFINPLAAQPAHIAKLALGWVAFSFAGMVLFGREAWQRHVDPFAIYFETLGRFAPLHVRAGRLALRPWARGLIDAQAWELSAAFCVAMLATVVFDGLLGTTSWRWVDRQFSSLAPDLNTRDSLLLPTLGLLACWALFSLAYAASSAVAAKLAGAPSRPEVARWFAPTLAPIAVAYLIAHYYSYLVIQGQAIVALASDPLGRGWNLFGTAGFTPDIAIIGARATWYLAIIAIVLGHVISVWLAHRVAMRRWSGRRAALASIPLTVLMVGYTAVSLSIIAEPLVRFRVPDESYSRATQPVADATIGL